MAETKDSAKPSSSKSPSADPISAASSKAQDVYGLATDAYLKYAEGIRQGRSSFERSYGESYRTFLDALGVARKEAEARSGEAFRRLQTATQDSQKLMVEAQQALLRTVHGGSPDSSDSAQVSSPLNSLEEARRQQEEAYRRFYDELHALWDADFLRRSQEAYRTYTDALQSAGVDMNRAERDAVRTYLKAAKDFWAELDVDTTASKLVSDTIRR